MPIWETLFCAAAALVLWTYAGYPAFVILLARLRKDKIEPTHSTTASHRISVLIVARNEEARIGAKLEHLCSLHAHAIHEIIIVCDHCTDTTAALATTFASRGVRCISHDDGPPGKAAALNAGIAAATGDLILLNDVRQTLAPGAIEKLAAHFHDPRTGAVSGALEIARAASGAGQGLDTYWTLEKRIRHAESVIDSSIGCTGAIYMIRRALFTPIPADTILDDVVIPMRIALTGARVRFAPDAIAHDPQPLTGPAESRRKTRTLAGNFQMLFRHPAWLLPWRNRLWWQLISHKYLRITTPPLLLLSLISCIVLAHHQPWRALLIAGLVILTLGTTGLAIPSLRSRLITILAAFLLLQISIAKGFASWITMRNQGYQGWK